MQTEETKKCNNCGYDMRGLSRGIKCPECGVEKTQSGSTSEGPDGKLLQLINANLAVKGLAPVPDIRVRTKYWMKLGGLFVTTLFVLQLCVTLSFVSIGFYRITLFLLSVAWPFVVVGMMPSSVDASLPPMYAWIRKVAPMSQWCWVAGYVLWLAFHVTTEEGTLGGNLRYFYPILCLHAIAGIGLAGIAFWLHDLALRLELDCAAKRCSVFAIATLSLGVLVFVLPWKHFAAAGLSGDQGAIMWWTYIFALMIPWLWVVSLFARALFEFSSDASWALRYDNYVEGRTERVRKKREEYESTRWF